MSTLNLLCLLVAALFLTACNDTSIKDLPIDGNSDLANATWISAQKDLPGIDSSFVDTAPFVGIRYCGISWESAFITTHYLQCARIMKKFASLMGDIEHEKLYGIILDRFWKAPVDGPINKQSLFATLLYHDIIPENEIDMAVDSLLSSLSNPTGHFTTGIFGTKYILEALSKTANSGTVFEIVNSTQYPGWGHMIDRGATTLWETWKESDDVYSNCHPMFGSVSEWFYRWLAGIRPHPDYPGFEKFIINPSLPAGLSHAYASYSSPYGEIEIPLGSLALVKLPMSEKHKISFTQNSSGQVISPERIDKNHCSFELPSGGYTILVHL